jgi:hypothetical protein
MAAITSFVEAPFRNGEYLVGEEPDYRSREVGVISGADLWPGTVLGRITANSKLVILAPGAVDGSQNAVGILWGKAFAASADVSATYTSRSASVNGLKLTWPNGITVGQKNTAIAQLLALFIVVRT